MYKICLKLFSSNLQYLLNDRKSEYKWISLKGVGVAFIHNHNIGLSH